MAKMKETRPFSARAFEEKRREADWIWVFPLSRLLSRLQNDAMTLPAKQAGKKIIRAAEVLPSLLECACV
jgi:hypothetical protein